MGIFGTFFSYLQKLWIVCLIHTCRSCPHPHARATFWLPFCLFFAGDFRSWSGLVALLSLCCLWILKMVDQDFPVYVTPLSIAWLISTNSNTAQFTKFRSSAHTRNLQVFEQLMYLQPVFFADILYHTIKHVLASYLPLPFPSFSTLPHPASVKMSELDSSFHPRCPLFQCWVV